MSTNTIDAVNSTKRSHGVLYRIGMIAALAGVLFGMDIGVISGALPYIQKQFNASDHMAEIIVSAMMLGAAVGACASMPLARIFGRKKTLSISAVVYIISALLCAMAASSNMLVAGRLVLGVAVGISTYVAPVYLSEIAPEKVRGRVISFYQFMIMGGILLAYLSNAGLSYFDAWRSMLGVIAIPALLLLVGVAFLPESPRWLAQQSRTGDARDVLMTLRGNQETVNQEMALIDESLHVPTSGFRLFLENSHFRRSVGLGILLQIMQQFTGANVILYYAPKILSLAGYGSSSEQLWGTVIIGLVMTLATLIAVGLVDRVGRKPLLYVGFTLMMICMFGMGSLFELGLQSGFVQYLALFILAAFVVSYAMSAAPVVWILCSEIQPLKGRNFGTGCSTVSNWVSNMIIGATFLTLINTLGSTHTFWLYAVFNLIFVLFTFAFVPETKGIPLELIERSLMAGKRLRNIGHTRQTS